MTQRDIAEERFIEGLDRLGVSSFIRKSNFIKKGLQHRCFPVKFAKFLQITSWLPEIASSQRLTEVARQRCS